MKGKSDHTQTPDKTKAGETQPAFSWQDCKNCGYHFEGQFCPSCGQSIKEVRQTLSQFISDFLGSMFALDIRLYRTIPTLLFKPGVLSRDYIEGIRKKHVAPFRLYFFVSIAFFFLLGWQTSRVVDREVSLGELNQAQTGIVRIHTDQNEGLGADTSLLPDDPGEKIKVTDEIRKELERQLRLEDLTARERANREKWIAYLGNPSVVINKGFQYLSWTLFLLMPWLALILYVFFKKRRKFYIEHLVYSVNIHTFVFVVLIIFSLFGMVFPDLLDRFSGYLLLIMLIYIVIGVRRFYRQKWAMAVVKTLTIMLVYSISSLVLLIGSVVLIVLII